MASSVLQNLGRLHIFTAVVAADGASMTSNDGSATIATTSAGLFTITFGDAWLSAPAVVATCLDATYTGVTDGVFNASITSLTTTALAVQTATGGDAGADGAATDSIVHVIAVGLRNNEGSAMSRLLDGLEDLHIFTATVAANGESMTSNDASASIATGGVGLFTITFGEGFRAAPTVGLTALDASYAGAADGVYNASITSISTTALVVQTADGGDADADGAAVDAICHVIAVGTRTN